MNAAMILPPPLTLRKAAAPDAAAVRRLVRAAYAKWVPVLGREPLPMQADYDRAVREHVIHLVCDGGKLVALIEWIVRPDHLFIENIAVSEPYQRRGLGRSLLLHAETCAMAAGLHHLRLLTSQAMADNIRLYLAFGFQVERTEPFKGGTTVYMAKALAPTG